VRSFIAQEIGLTSSLCALTKKPISPHSRKQRTKIADQNQTQIYEAQYEAIAANFQATDGETDWRLMATQLAAALSDPFLPRYHRARYHIIYAWCAREPQLELQKARETLEDMRLVLWESSEEEIDAILRPLREVLKITEDVIAKDDIEM
jgi:5-formyltetrahydrofolate cyclo-ligase